MMRTLLLSLAVLGVATAVAIGSYTALADKGGPGHGVDHGVANGLQDEGGADGVEAQDNGEGEPEMVGAEAIAEAIAEQFEGVDAETVLELHADGNGFGKLYHAYLIAAASGGTMTVEDVLAAAATDGFGQMFQELADEVAALSAGEDGVPKNLGGVVSEAKKADAGAAVAAANGGDEDGGHGPPDGVPAHGRN
jgi:hypothetical protein